MSDQNTYTPHYSLADIEQYLQGKMTAPEMYALEKAALQDPFLADAIEGYNAASMPEAHQHLREIQELLLPGKTEAKVIPLPATTNKNWRFAAIAILLLGAGIITWLLLPNGNNKQVIAKTTVTDSIAVLQQNSAAVAGNAPRALPSNQVKTDSILSYLSQAPATEKHFFKQQQVTTQKDSPALYANTDVLKKELVAAMPDTIQQSPQSGNTYTFKDKLVAEATTLPMNISGNRLQGRITNQKGEAIAGASVNINHSNHNIVTDANGNFSFVSPDTSANITVNSLGYIPQQNMVSANGNKYFVLQENTNALNEITIVGYGAAKKRNATGVIPADNKMAIMKIDTLMPEGGWDKFKQYVANTIIGENNLDDIQDIELLHGELEFEFRVDENGNAKDITILKSPDENKNGVIAEAVKQGPRWAIPDKKKKRKNKAIIHF